MAEITPPIVFVRIFGTEIIGFRNAPSRRELRRRTPDTLDNVDGNKPTQQLLAAIAVKNGVTQTELAEWYGTGRRTIYSWLMRLDTDESLEQAVADAKRTGRK